MAASEARQRRRVYVRYRRRKSFQARKPFSIHKGATTLNPPFIQGFEYTKSLALFNDSRSTVFQTNNKAQEWVSDWGSAKIAKLCVVTQEEDLSCCECCSCCLCFMLLLLRINNITTHVHAYWIDP